MRPKPVAKMGHATGAVSAALCATVLAAAFAGALMRPRVTTGHGRPIVTIVALVVFGGSSLTQLSVGWVVQPVGPGNSVVVFSLAASLAVLALRDGAATSNILGWVSVIGSAVLLLTGDIHGGAAAVGAGLAVALARTPSS